MLPWNEARNCVTQAFEEWKLIERDQRAFLRLGLVFAQAEYDRIWTQAGEEPWDEGAGEQVDVFENKVDGLWPADFTWMHLSGVIRDAVSSFEVYLEKACEEVRGRQGEAVVAADRSPGIAQLLRFFTRLDPTLDLGATRHAIDLRNFLTHRRGELRTKRLRDQFQATHEEAFAPFLVELTCERVLEVLDALADSIRRIDPTAYASARA